jgi:3-methyladenine DNA glycosylase AlkD
VKINKHHKAILEEIKAHSGVGTSHTFLDSYLGNSNFRYAINAPKLRAIAKEWGRNNKMLTSKQFCDVVDSLVHGPSSTEKMMAGIILDCATSDQSQFDPTIFDEWLEQLIGWAEVDAVCTGKFMIKSIPSQWNKWEKIIKRFAKSRNIQKRRASLVLFCSPIVHCEDAALADLAFQNIDLLKHEKEGLITKAISWLLRSMIKHHKSKIIEYLQANSKSLPAIAVRETTVKLTTGTKTNRAKSQLTQKKK